MQQLEQQLEQLFKKVSYQLPESARSTLVRYIPWLTVAGGALMMILAFMSATSALWVGGLYSYAVAYAPTLGPSLFLLWLSIGLLVIEALLFFMAFPALQAHKKKGWDILFWVSLVNLAHGIVSAIATANVGSLLFGLLGSAVGLWLLFQIRSHYNVAGQPLPPAKSSGPMPPPTTKNNDKKE